MGRVDVQSGFWWGNLIERDHLEKPDVDIRMILKRMRGVSSLAEKPLVFFSKEDSAPWS
jgi:hypothetical protein